MIRRLLQAVDPVFLLSWNGSQVSLRVAQGYVGVSDLLPGQGAWVLRHTAGAIVLGRLLATSGEAAVQRAQALLSTDPTNRGTVDMVSQATGEPGATWPGKAPSISYMEGALLCPA